MSRNQFDPVELLRQVMDNDFDLTVFRQIDESHFPEAPNFLEFVVGREFCNATILPWQVEANMHLFSEYCPECSDPEYLNELFDEPLEEIRDRVTLLQHGVCPKCRKNKLDLFTIGELHPSMPSLKSEAVICAGQRSGKSKDVVIAAAYLLHRWCKIPDPIDYFGLPKMEIVLGTFSALSATQADENLWMPFRGLYDSAPWFQKYNEFLRGEQKRLSIPLVDVKDTYLYYLHKRMLLEFTGSDDRKKRGRTRLFGAIDEVAYLNTDKKAAKVMDADKNYAALNNSLATIRKKAMMRLKKFKDFNTIMPVMFNASSPKNVQDKIWTLTKSAPMNPWCHAIHRATWELNPDFSQEDCRNINQGISEIDFWRDFGAIPPYSDSPYLSDSGQLMKLCQDNLTPFLEGTKDIFIDRMGDRYLMLKAKIIRPDKVIPRMISFDNGFKNNAFAITMFRWDAGRRKPVMDFAINLQPQPDARLFINFPAIFDNFVIPVIKAFRITDVFYDRWQSLDQIQRLRNFRIDANAHSLHFEKDFMPFKQMILSSGIGLPPCSIAIDTIKDMADPLGALQQDPVATLIWQCLTVREVGRKVMKPLDGDDDLFRAFVLGGSRFLDEKFRKKYEVYQSVLSGHDRAPVGRTYSFGQSAPHKPGAAQRIAPYATARTFGKKPR